MKRLSYGFLGLACAYYAAVNWMTPACLSAAANSCDIEMVSRRAPFLGLAVFACLVFLASAVLPSSDIQTSFSEAADWVLVAAAVVASLAVTVALGHTLGAWGAVLPACLLLAMPLLLRKGLRVLSRY